MDQKPTITIEDVAELLRDDRLRGYKIDIETDQMVESDENAEKQRRIELATASGQMIQQVAPLLASPQGAALTPMLKAISLFTYRGFRAGREIEEAIENGFDAIEKQLSQPQQPQEDPEAKAKAEAAMLSAQIEQERVQIEKAEAASRIRLNEEKHQIEAMRLAKEVERADAEVALKARDADLKERSQRDDMDARRAEQNLRIRKGEDGSEEVVSAMDYRDEEMRMLMAQMAQAVNQMGAGLAQMAQAQSAPKQVVRDENGRVIGVSPISPSIPPTI